MDRRGPAQPRLSRETRLLLVTILVAMAALWALARLRFPERPATPNPVTPLLTQLAVSPGFDDLATQVSTLESRLLPSLVPVDVRGAAAPALRVRDDIGATLLPAPNGDPSHAAGYASTILAHDAVSGLALVRVPGAPAPELTVWSPQRLDRPRYLFASDFSHRDASLRPVFIGRLHPATNPGWPGEVWALPVRTAVAPGDLLFTTDGALAGLVIPHAGALAVVPGETLLGAADLLRSHGAVPAGWLGIDVHGLTPSLSAATGARGGVIVSRVHPDGPAAGALAATDVIEAANGEPIASLDDWRALAARVRPDGSVELTVRRRAEVFSVTIAGAAPPARTLRQPLGLTLRTVGGVGAEVLEVTTESAAARAGILAGDVIIAIGDIQKPTAAQVTRAFSGLAERPLLAVIARGESHRVVALAAK